MKFNQKEYQEMKELQQEYDSIFRPKTLVEEYREQKSKQPCTDRKKEIEEYMTRPFNRESDLRISNSTAKTFELINGKDSLDSRFGNQHFLSQK